MATYGLLIDYEWCSGCQSCEVSCKEEHGYPVGKWGIRVLQDGPWEIEDKQYNWNKVPVPTDLCDLCAERTALGKVPICVHHCLADVLVYGPVQELAKRLEEKPKQALFVPQFKPIAARGPFVSANRAAGKVTQFKAIEVEANTDFDIAGHRRPVEEDEGGMTTSVILTDDLKSKATDDK
jgi:anaerobic dimethyl sulfoxide reductase subunit B (iron-sulfur subunit)